MVYIVDLTDLLAAENMIGIIANGFIVRDRLHLKSEHGEQLLNLYTNKSDSLRFLDIFTFLIRKATAAWNPAFQQVRTALGFLAGVVCQNNQSLFKIFLSGVFKDRIGDIASGTASSTGIGCIFVDELSEIAERLV